MKIIDVEKTVGEFHLQIPELSLEKGKIHGLLGGNGSGKTTTAKILMGILQPDRGRIDYEGITMQQITMTFQRPYLIHASVYENLIYPLKIRKEKPEEKKMNEMLEQFDLLEKKHQYARSLSSGEQQKLSMLRALIFEPEFLIIDETLSNMDPESVEKFETLILEKQKTHPVTWVLISHRLTHLYKLSDRLHFFYQGQILASGKKEEILFQNPDARIRSFLANEMIRP